MKKSQKEGGKKKKKSGVSFLDKLAAWGQRHIPDSYAARRCCSEMC